MADKWQSAMTALLTHPESVQPEDQRAGRLWQTNRRNAVARGCTASARRAQHGTSGRWPAPPVAACSAGRHADRPDDGAVVGHASGGELQGCPGCGGRRRQRRQRRIRLARLAATRRGQVQDRAVPQLDADRGVSLQRPLPVRPWLRRHARAQAAGGVQDAHLPHVCLDEHVPVRDQVQVHPRGSRLTPG